MKDILSEWLYLLPTVRPVARSSLFYVLQVVTLFTLFTSAYLYYPTTRLGLYFSTIFAVHLRVYIQVRWGVRQACTMSCFWPRYHTDCTIFSFVVKFKYIYELPLCNFPVVNHTMECSVFL